MADDGVKTKKNTTLLGIEPRISGFVDQRLIHWATESFCLMYDITSIETFTEYEKSVELSEYDYLDKVNYLLTNKMGNLKSSPSYLAITAL